jgi:hypothetical protein
MKVLYKRGVIVASILLFFAVVARATTFNYTSPLGCLIFASSFVLISWVFEFFSPGHVKYSKDNWRARDYKGWKMATDQATCPECGNDEVVFDTLELMNFPVEARCKKCGHKWWYTPPI